MKSRLMIVGLIITTMLISLAGCKSDGNGSGSGIELPSGDNYAYAATSREGIVIKPTLIDGAGIGAASNFIMTFDEGMAMTLEEVKKAVTLDPSIEVDISLQGEGYLIDPSRAFEKGEIIKLMVNEVTWLFQCAYDFSLIGTLPRNEATNVPLNSGIELYFSHPGAEVEDYFAIEPAVDGAFETYGSTVVFLPKTLDAQTVYTITLQEGLSLQDSEQALNGPNSFSFETGIDEANGYEDAKGYFNYFNLLNDYSLTSPIYIPLRFNVYDEKVKAINVESTVYQYKNAEAMALALEGALALPSWRHFYSEDEGVEVAGLDVVIDFEQTIEDLNVYETTIDLPVTLDQGFYLVKSSWQGIEFQTFVQVTDLSYFYFEDALNGYMWLNDLGSQKVASGSELKGNESIKADNHGFMTIPKKEVEGGVTHIVNYEDKELLHYAYGIGSYYYQNNRYWKYVQTDRNLYKPKDSVEIFGYLQNRDTGQSPETVTISIEEQAWYFDWYWPSFEETVPLVHKELQVDHGFYEGSFELPNLEEGGYQIEIKVGEDLVGTHYIQVEAYVKPDYKIEVESDKAAVFIGEPVTFTTRTSFFEGTPVAKLEVAYDIYGTNYQGGSGLTDLDGEFSVQHVSTYRVGYQDEIYGGYSTYASLPESGELYGQTNVRVFVNDVHLAIETEVEDGTGSIDLAVHEITLDRLNDLTAEDRNDYLAEPVAGHVVKGTIYRNEWVKEESGDYYDFINKTTQTRYTYRQVSTKLQDLELVTDNDGHVTMDLELPEERGVYYTLTSLTTDSKGREMVYESYFGRGGQVDYPDDERLRMVVDEDQYKVGDTMTIALMKGDELASGVRYLYLFGTAGLQKALWSDEASIEAAFTERYLPQVGMTGVIFNGESYEMASSMARVIQDTYKIDLEITTDQVSYRPGEEVTLNLIATTNDGQSLTDGRVNISIVDEALFALSDQEVDPLAYLYGWLDSGLSQMHGSHNNGSNDGLYPMVKTLSGAMDAGSTMEEMESTTEYTDTSGGNASGVMVRDVFKDTALFKTLALDNEGRGSISFTLPDNVTAWRITGAVVSESLQAGSQVEALKVSLPFFISTTLNQSYLVGDEPMIGVTAYGDQLVQGETISYKVTCQATGYEASGTGVAYERLRLPLFQLEAGSYDIQVTAETASGMVDGYEETIVVIPSYQEKRVSESYEGIEGMTITTSDFGMTAITFTDSSKGAYLPELYRLAYGGGKRVDQNYLAYMSRSLLEGDFGVSVRDEVVKLSDYLSYEGGVALLPYGQADLMTTAKISPYIEDGTDEKAVKAYLYSNYYDTSIGDKPLALYGLILMGEPLLNELNQWQMVENLDIESRLWLALSYGALGDSYMAKVIYEKSIEPYIESYEGMARLVRSDDLEDHYRMTAMALPLLALLDEQLADDAYEYVKSHGSETYLANLDLYHYITYRMDQSEATESKVSYSYDGHYETLELNNGFGKTITLPSAKMAQFRVEEVTSNVTLVVDYNAIGNQVGAVDDNVQVSRRYEAYDSGEVKTSFKEGDIVRVVLDWSISDQAIDHGYMVTDYAPSGLVPIKNYWQFGIDQRYYWYRDIEGQKVSFGVYKGADNYRPLEYYARVVSPGKFKGDMAMIQGLNILDSYQLTEASEITIEE